MKRLFIPLISSIFLYSCNDTSKYQSNETVAPKLSNYENTIADYFQAFNNYEWEKFASFYTDTAEFLDPEFGTDYVKKTQHDIVTKYTGMQKAMPGLKDSLISMYTAGDNVIVEFIASGSLPGGGKFSLPLCTVFTFKNGKITRDATYYDK
jgi:ketosteroid isomerase-like protein